jgi:ribonuclease BN (tRNA processing enzyme)
MQITPLGTNGFIPTYGRQTMSFLVEAGARALVLDAGSGLSRLLEPPLAERLAGYGELDLVLTHYHLDHVVGLSYLPAVWRDRPLRLWAPTEPLVDARAEEALERLLAPPLFPLRLKEFPAPIEVHSYGGEKLRAGPWRLRLRRQRHGGGSVGVVVDERLAYLTDCEAEAASAAFAAGVELMLHEVWVTAAEVAAGEPRHGHSTLEEVAELARAAGVATLMPVHHRPDRGGAEVEELGRRLGAESGCRVILPVEGMRYPVGAPRDEE